MFIELGVSARHVHVSQEDLETLFGPGYELTKFKDLKQTGQYAANEKVQVEGPKGSFQAVRILGPVRKASQVEVSATDCLKLGVNAMLRDSGKLEGTPGVILTGPAGKVNPCSLKISKLGKIQSWRLHVPIPLVVYQRNSFVCYPRLSFIYTWMEPCALQHC